MANSYVNGQVTVGTTPTLIAVIPAVSNLVVNASAACFVGGANVTATTGANQGIPLAATTNTTLPASTSVDNLLYGICASGTVTVNYLYASSVF